MHNNKLATYHSWFAIPSSRNERMPNNVPQYLHLDLSKHAMRNISRFRLRAHTLKVEAAAWLEDGSCVCDQCPGEDEHVQNEVHAQFLFRATRMLNFGLTVTNHMLVNMEFASIGWH